MVKEFKFNEFVNLCNRCNKNVTENPTDDGSARLANGIEEIKENTLFHFKDINDQEFYNSLIRRGYTTDSNEYKFLCDETIVADVAPLIPFDDKRILKQKWHVLISLLAYLDTASFDKNAKMSDRYKFDKIESIVIDYNKYKPLKVIGKKKTREYNCKLMIDWIKFFV